MWGKVLKINFEFTYQKRHLPQIPQLAGGKVDAQVLPYRVQIGVKEIRLCRLDVEVDGVRGAVSKVDALPRILMAGFRLVLLACHPHRHTGILQLQPVEGAG